MTLHFLLSAAPRANSAETRNAQARLPVACQMEQCGNARLWRGIWFGIGPSLLMWWAIFRVVGAI